MGGEEEGRRGKKEGGCAPRRSARGAAAVRVGLGVERQPELALRGVAHEQLAVRPAHAHMRTRQAFSTHGRSAHTAAARARQNGVVLLRRVLLLLFSSARVGHAIGCTGYSGYRAPGHTSTRRVGVSAGHAYGFKPRGGAPRATENSMFW